MLLFSITDAPLFITDAPLFSSAQQWPPQPSGIGAQPSYSFYPAYLWLLVLCSSFSMGQGSSHPTSWLLHDTSYSPSGCIFGIRAWHLPFGIAASLLCTGKLQPKPFPGGEKLVNMQTLCSMTLCGMTLEHHKSLTAMHTVPWCCLHGCVYVRRSQLHTGWLLCHS